MRILVPYQFETDTYFEAVFSLWVCEAVDLCKLYGTVVIDPWIA